MKSPWSWIPSLYFAEGLPYVAVMTISLILYKQLGLSNADITFYTSWLYLPWVIKPLWSPFIDIVKTNRWWITTMQLLIGAAFGGIAFTIPSRFILDGRGWGHGVGLCQIGAAVMGEQGFMYNDILLHYYQNAEIKKAY